MNEKSEQETQHELFQEFSGETPQKGGGRLSFLSKNQRPILLNTNAEQLILAGILLILAACFVFFLGVMRGKSLRQLEPVATKNVAAVLKPAAPVAATQNIPPATGKSTKTPPAQMAADLNKPYTIQLCTYKGSSLAEKEVALLRKKGYYSFIIPSGDYYQVCVGQYVSKEHARKDLKVFNPIYKGCFLRRR